MPPSGPHHRRPGRSTQRGGIFGWLLKWLVIVVLGWVFLTGAFVWLLRWVPPPTSAFMLEARAQARANGDRDYVTAYEWVGLERISQYAALAVIASEDQQFPFHAGFDVGSIRDAVRANEHGHKLRGASTISQQVAKNLFLWSGHSFFRKGLEAWLTVLIEGLWPKERTLEVYLNVVEFGRGIYGVEAAAQHFYRKPAAQLSSSDSALLAAVLPNPHLLRVERPSAYLLSRRDWILGQMRALGGASYLRALEKEPRAPAKDPQRRH